MDHRNAEAMFVDRALRLDRAGRASRCRAPSTANSRVIVAPIERASFVLQHFEERSIQ
ncbi:MAG: hypothetical protein M2R45_05166 [Verrucomicrobia subdivision 3 bacterium]|nr:hypothetical protein [Limisphaerales bacterium]